MLLGKGKENGSYINNFLLELIEEEVEGYI